MKSCLYLINVPSASSIELRVDDFFLEPSNSCQKDYFGVFNRGFPFNYAEGNFYCGRNLPEQLVVNANILWLEFVSDKDDGDTGFLMRYKISKITATTKPSPMGKCFHFFEIWAPKVFKSVEAPSF